ncbi:hypothetical protein Golob_016326 [Gossypium lobatum]|uniref:Uncharacterized protein n=1 Tax=Gossypium lobatum TaxID=34289 RepID=A0A7J8M420_9ROSI|nr:hypothetical protein [Gossypium lobatum]
MPKGLVSMDLKMDMEDTLVSELAAFKYEFDVLRLAMVFFGANVCSLSCRRVAEWDPWGVPDDYECEVIENDAPIPKHVPQHRPGPLPEEFYKTLEALSKKDEPKVTSGDPQIKE